MACSCESSLRSSPASAAVQRGGQTWSVAGVDPGLRAGAPPEQAHDGPNAKSAPRRACIDGGATDRGGSACCGSCAKGSSCEGEAEDRVGVAAVYELLPWLRPPKDGSAGRGEPSVWAHYARLFPAFRVLPAPGRSWPDVIRGFDRRVLEAVGTAEGRTAFVAYMRRIALGWRDAGPRDSNVSLDDDNRDGVGCGMDLASEFLFARRSPGEIARWANSLRSSRKSAAAKAEGSSAAGTTNGEGDPKKGSEQDASAERATAGGLVAQRSTPSVAVGGGDLSDVKLFNHLPLLPCSTRFATRNSAAPDVLYRNTSNPADPKNRPVSPVLCRYIIDGQSGLSVAEGDGPAALGYRGVEGFRPMVPFVGEDGVRRVWSEYPGPNEAPPEPFARRLNYFYKVDDVGSWQIYVAHAACAGSDRFLVDAAGLLMQIMHATVHNWRLWAEDSGFNGFGILVRPWGPVTADVPGQWPWESDIALQAGGYGEQVDFLEEFVRYLDEGNVLVIYPMTRESLLAWRAEDGVEDRLVGGAMAMLNHGAFAWWPRTTSAIFNYFSSAIVSIPSRSVEDWWHNQGGAASGGPSLDIPSGVLCGQALAGVLRVLIHEVGHIVFWQVFGQSSSDDVDGYTLWGCPGLEPVREGGPGWSPDSCSRLPNWCQGPMWTRWTIPGLFSDAMNRQYFVPEDATDGGPLPAVSRHWMLDALGGWAAGLLQHDVGAMMQYLHLRCCDRHYSPPNQRPWAYDPAAWYGGLGYCPQTPP